MNQLAHNEINEIEHLMNMADERGRAAIANAPDMEIAEEMHRQRAVVREWHLNILKKLRGE